MPLFPDLSPLRTSWTKYDIVQVIEIASRHELTDYINQEKSIDGPILRAFLGVDNLNEPIPYYWEEIYEYPNQVGLFALIAAVFSHEWAIAEMKRSATGNMQGKFILKEGKQYTNLRSALVESGASEKIYRRRSEVPYDLSKLYEIGRVGELVKDLLIDRLVRIGYPKQDAINQFMDFSLNFEFPRVFALSDQQYKEWIQGSGISNSLYELEKNGITYEKYGRIPALKVNQWLTNWNDVPNFDHKNRQKPEPYFYQFNIPAILLKRIYDVHSRLAYVNRKDEPFSQRKHSEERSREIREFVQGGFPWSTISEEQRATNSYKNLQMPGWLPTSIIANILTSGSERRQKIINENSVIKIEHVSDKFAEIILPEAIWTDKWTPMVAPIEIIDGQHRIKAFDGVNNIYGQFELPIVAFLNLDFTWQAYLFYTINIKPKRINTSLAYDLMPLLRIQDWLEQDLNGPDIYKKVRAQELTELLWTCEVSPWYNRINMLGDTGENKGGPVSQNAFINSLSVSFVKKWEGTIGGLFGGEMHEGMQDVIQWDKETQAAFLILIWQSIVNAIRLSKATWVRAMEARSNETQIREVEMGLPIAFIHRFSFFTTDQGVRAILQIFNDFCFEANDLLELNKFVVDVDYEKYDTSELIEIIYEKFKEKSIICSFISNISRILVDQFDWRTPSAFNSNDPHEDALRQNQNQFRGSSGYREMRMQLLRILNTTTYSISERSNLSIGNIAALIQNKLGF